MRVIFLFLLLNFFSCSFLLGDPDEDFLSADSISGVPAGTAHKGTYFGVGDDIGISGVVLGNVYVIGSRILIDGEIDGNLVAVGETVVITGKIHGHVKVVTGQADIIGDIGGDLTVLGVNVSLLSPGRVGGSVFFAGGYGEVEDLIEGRVTALAGGLKVSGMMKENLHTFVGRLRIESGARICGSLRYRSGHTAVVDPKAQIGGQLIYSPTLLKDIMNMPILRKVVIGSKVAGFLMNFLYTLVIGIIFIRLFPRRLQRIELILSKYPWRCLGYGLLVLVAVPLISIVLLVTVIGAPFALTLMALNVISFYTMKIFSILSVSNILFGKLGWKKNRIPTLAAGQVLYYLVVLIPVFGWIIASFAMLFGLGASAVNQVKKG